MLELIREFFSYAFLLRALLVGVMICLCAGLLGVSLVLKRYSMIGDGLSHVAFGSLAIASALHLMPLMVAVPVVMLASFFLLRLTQNAKIKGDAAVALLSCGSLAIGITAISVTSGVNTDIYNYLFGSVLAIQKQDVIFCVVLCLVVAGLYLLCYHRIFLITFDETFARACGMPVSFYNSLLSILTSITIVLGMRLMGSLLISAIILLPALTSLRLYKRFAQVVLCAAVVSVLCFVIALILSLQFALPTGATIVLVNLCFFLFAWLVSALRKKG